MSQVQYAIADFFLEEWKDYFEGDDSDFTDQPE